MLESQSFNHKLILTSFAMLLLLGWLSSQSFAVTQTDIEITTPKYNTVQSSSSIVISGTFASTNTPTITLTIEGITYAVSIDTTKNIWGTTLSLPNGWHTVKATINDGGKTLSTSSQFMINTGGNKGQIKYPRLNIEYSQACLALIKQHDYSVCPPLSEIAPLDTSNQHVSGKLITDSKGLVTRTEPQLRNDYMWYKNFTICVGCKIDAQSESTMQNIFLEANSFPYSKHTYATVSTNNTGFIKLVPYNYTTTFNEASASLTINYDRYVTDNCMEANLVYSHDLLVDTINYMKSNCKVTFINKTTITPIPYHPIDYKNPYSSLAYKAIITKIKSTGGLGNCMQNQCNIKDPYAKVGYR